MPIVTLLGMQIGKMFYSVVVVETVFAWPGFGQFMTHSLLRGDMNAVMGCVLVVGLVFITLNLIADTLYHVFDPRIR